MTESIERNRRILIIDGDEAIHEDSVGEVELAIFGECSDSSRAEGFEVDSAFQGQEGLEMIRQALQDGRPYAMAFVDALMPSGWDVVETIERIRREYPDLQVVICTAYSDYTWPEIVEKLGTSKKLLILKKPFDGIVVRQLAGALTEKWHLSQQAKVKYRQLERIVKERTRQLQEKNAPLEGANRELTMALAEAEQAERAKMEFLAKMSREIRTPMNGVIGFSEILAEEDLTEEQKTYVNHIRESGKNLLLIINDILDFSKIEAGKLDIEPIPCSLTELLGGIESLMQLEATEKDLEFRIRRSDRLPEQITTDPVRIRQCLINLVNNAIKFTETGHVYLSASLEAKDNRAFVRFDVEDTGIGIPYEKQEKIFESFRQADGSTSRKYGGTGLGLTITKRLAELLGGELTLTSEPGQGSLFSLIIPTEAGVTEPALPAGYDSAEIASSPLIFQTASGMTVSDDEPGKSEESHCGYEHEDDYRGEEDDRFLDETDGSNFADFGGFIDDSNR